MEFIADPHKNIHQNGVLFKKIREQRIHDAFHFTAFKKASEIKNHTGED
jgi:hypothetical protein